MSDLELHKKAWREWYKESMAGNPNPQTFEEFWVEQACARRATEPTPIKPTAPKPATVKPAPVKPGVEQRGGDRKRHLAELRKRIEARRFNFESPPPPAEPRFFVAGRPVCTPGNLTTIIAQAKGGKSSLLAAFVAATICAEHGVTDRDTLGVTATAPNGRRLLWLDTEQSPEHADQLVRGVMRRAGVEGFPDWLRPYHVAGFGADDMKDTLLLLATEAAASGGLHAIIIDGIADMVLDVNDAAESNALVSSLHDGAIRFNCPILAVIHDNEGARTNGDGRGHLGKQLMRKAESNLRLKKADEITVVFSEKMRRAPIPERDGPRFRWSDEAGMHVSCETVGTSRDTAKRERLRDLAEAVFQNTGSTALSWTAFRDGIVKSEDLTKSGATKRFDQMRALQVVEKDGIGLWRLVQ